MLDEVFHSDAARSAISKRQTPPAIPREHFRTAGKQVDIKMVGQNMRATGHVDQQISRSPYVAKTTPIRWQHFILSRNSRGIQLHADLLEKKPCDWHPREKKTPKALF